MNNFNKDKKYLTTKELAIYLNISESTLIAYRANECGPVYRKIGRLVRYEIDEIIAWIKREDKKNKKDTAGLDNRQSLPNLTVISNN